MKKIFSILLISNYVFAADIDSGIRIKKANETIRLAAESGTPTSPARMKLGNKVIGIPLVPITSQYASAARINTPAGVKALKKYVPTWTPQTCVFRGSAYTTDNNNNVVTGYGPSFAQCPSNFAVFVSSNGDLLNYMCCELPNEGMLAGPVNTRIETCAANEVMVGAHLSTGAGTMVYCKSLDTSKYKLGTPQESCVWSFGGTAGWGNAPTCGGYPAVIGGQGPDGNSYNLGSDGCTGQPYGAVMVSRTSKKCSKQSYSQIQYLNGTPVQMFQP